MIVVFKGMVYFCRLLCPEGISNGMHMLLFEASSGLRVFELAHGREELRCFSVDQNKLAQKGLHDVSAYAVQIRANSSAVPTSAVRGILVFGHESLRHGPKKSCSYGQCWIQVFETPRLINIAYSYYPWAYSPCLVSCCGAGEI